MELHFVQMSKSCVCGAIKGLFISLHWLSPVQREYFHLEFIHRFTLHLEIDNLRFPHSHHFYLYRNISNPNGRMLSIGFQSGRLILLCHRRPDRQRMIFLMRNDALLVGSEDHPKMLYNLPTLQIISSSR